MPNIATSALLGRSACIFATAVPPHLLNAMKSALPAVLEPHRTYLDRANELAGPHPLVALQCRLMCLQLGMAARGRQDLSELAACELRQWVVSTLEECEAARARLGATAADPEAALAALRSLGLELIARARPLRHNRGPNPRAISLSLARPVARTQTLSRRATPIVPTPIPPPRCLGRCKRRRSLRRPTTQGPCSSTAASSTALCPRSCARRSCGPSPDRERSHVR